MSENDNWTNTIDKEVLKWILDNSNEIEAITPRMLVKIMDIKNAEPDRWKEMANIKFGV